MKILYKTSLIKALAAAAPLIFAAAAAPKAAFAQSGAPAVIYDANRLPAPVRRMRERLLHAVKSGDIEALRPLFGAGDNSTRITGDAKQDPIAYLKQISADGSGLEVLANLAQILNSGAVKETLGGQTVYVWPYFAAVSPKTLSPAQTVEAYEIMSADDLDAIKEIGRYIYFRAGIAADGSWRFFLTGDESAETGKTDGATGKTKDEEPALPNRSALPLPDDSDDIPDE